MKHIQLQFGYVPCGGELVSPLQQPLLALIGSKQPLNLTKIRCNKQWQLQYENTQASLVHDVTLEKGGVCQRRSIHNFQQVKLPLVKSDAAEGFWLAAGCSLIKHTPIVYQGIKGATRRLSTTVAWKTPLGMGWDQSVVSPKNTKLFAKGRPSALHLHSWSILLVK